MKKTTRMNNGEQKENCSIKERLATYLKNHRGTQPKISATFDEKQSINLIITKILELRTITC